MNQCRKIDEVEIKFFLGLIIYMGFVKQPKMYYYFEKFEISATSE